MLSKEIKEEIRGVAIPATPMGEDKILWKESSDGRYSTATAYSICYVTMVAMNHNYGR